MNYKWQFTTDEENPEGYYQKLVNMNTPEVLRLEEAADRLNELDKAVELAKAVESLIEKWDSLGADKTKSRNILNDALVKFKKS